MGLCKDCFHREVCEFWTTIKLDDIPPEIPCGHFKDTSDIAPKAEVDEWICRSREWHDIAEKKQKQARQEVAREIFEEIAKMFFEKQKKYENSHQSGKARQMMVARFEVYKLKKKYTEDNQ